MDANNSPEFFRRLTGLAEVFDVKLSSTRRALYFEALRDLSVEAVISALNQAVRTCKFFPRPAELLALAIGDSETAEESAWIAFRKAMHGVGAYRSVSFDDPSLGDTIVAVFGSWPAACSAEFSPEMWAAKRKEFGRVYRVYVGRHLEQSPRLTGIFEQTNGTRLEWQKYNERACIGPDGETRLIEAGPVEPPRAEIAPTTHEFSQIRDSLLRLVPKSMDDTA